MATSKGVGGSGRTGAGRVLSTGEASALAREANTIQDYANRRTGMSDYQRRRSGLESEYEVDYAFRDSFSMSVAGGGRRTVRDANVYGSRSNRVAAHFTQTDNGPRYGVTPVTSGLSVGTAPNRFAASIAAREFSSRINWGSIFNSRGAQRNTPEATRELGRARQLRNDLRSAGLMD